MQSEASTLTRQRSAPATTGEYGFVNPHPSPPVVGSSNDYGYSWHDSMPHTRGISQEQPLSRTTTLNDEQLGMSRAEHGLFPRGTSPAQRRIEPPGNGYAYVPTYDSQATFVDESYTHAPRQALNRLWERFSGKNRKRVGWRKSLKNIALSSVLNSFVILIPVAWASHLMGDWPDSVTFTLCFFSIMSLVHLFEYGGKQMAFYCGKDLGDLIIITLNNAVEATLGIILLVRCELKLLQSTIIGVILLRLLLVPGTAYVVGGARVWEQDLHPHLTSLNQTLLMTGVMTLFLPAAFFAALDRGVIAMASKGLSAEAKITAESDGFLTDGLRGQILKISRGLAILLLLVYICSRIFVHNPPGEDNALAVARRHDAPEELKYHEHHLANADPEVNPWMCILLLVVSIGLMAPTAAFLIIHVEHIDASIQEEWFGLILLPIMSFSADGVVTIIYFIRYMLRHFFGTPREPSQLANSRSIDTSIQFALFWMPMLVLIAWFTGKPLTLLFDFFEVALLLGACFLVNYVTADAKTNWAEGTVMVAFYVMIALIVWFYPGQPEIHEMLLCGSIQESLSGDADGRAATGGNAEAQGGAEGAGHGDGNR